MIKLIAALALSTTTVTPQKEPTPCLQKAEALALFNAMIPAFIEAATTRCSSVLPPQAFLRTGAIAYAERLRQESMLEPGALLSALSKVGGKDMPPGISDKTVVMLTNDIAKGLLAQQIRDKSCGGIDEIIEAVSPLSAKNFTMLFSGIISVAPETSPSDDFRICPAETDG